MEGKTTKIAGVTIPYGHDLTSSFLRYKLERAANRFLVQTGDGNLLGADLRPLDPEWRKKRIRQRRF